MQKLVNGILVDLTQDEIADREQSIADNLELNKILAIKNEIKELENSITPRRQREAILGIDQTWLADIELQIAQLRAKL